MKYFRAVNIKDPEDVLYLSSSCDSDTQELVEKRTKIKSYGYELQECSENEFNAMTQEENEYIINVGEARDQMEPFESAHTEKEGRERAEELTEFYNCVEVVYMPQENVDINEIVWCCYR